MIEKIKNGWKTSEFWFGLIGAVVIAVMKHLNAMDDTTLQSIAGIIMTYIGGRSVAKVINGKK